MNTNALSILTMIKSVNWDAIAAISGSVAAIMAAGQLWQSRIDSNRRLAISLLRDFTIIHEKLNQYDLAETMESVLRSYRQKVPLTGPGADYISFLHSLEFIAHSYFAGGIDKKIVDRFLRGMLESEAGISIDFIREIQSCQHNDDAAEWSARLIQRYTRRKQRRIRVNGRTTQRQQIQSVIELLKGSVRRSR